MFTKCPNPVMQINYISCWILSSLERKFQYNNNIPGVGFSGGLFFKSASAVTTVPLTQYYSNIVFPCPTRHYKPPFILHHLPSVAMKFLMFSFLWNLYSKTWMTVWGSSMQSYFWSQLCYIYRFFLLLNVLVEHFYTWLHTVLLINDLHII